MFSSGVEHRRIENDAFSAANSLLLFGHADVGSCSPTCRSVQAASYSTEKSRGVGNQMGLT